MKKDSTPLILGASIERAGIGGVTIHLQRLMQWLNHKNYSFVFCDYKTLSICKQLLMILHHKVVHLHISRSFPRFIYVVYSRIVKTRTIITFHGNVGQFSAFNNLIDQLSIRLCSIPILINKNSFQQAIKWNINSVNMSAFLPPFDEGYLPDYVSYEIESSRKSGKTIIASNASAMSYTHSGEEIYGIDFCIEYFQDKPEYLFCVSDPSGNYFDKYKNKILKNVLFITASHSFFKLIKLADVVLRYTATDGDALSVKEGLYLRKKVIATDRVARPEGVILCKYHDTNSLECALSSNILFNDDLLNEDVSSKLIAIYNSLK